MPRRIHAPILKPKMIFTYPRWKVRTLTLKIIYDAFSRWQERCYPEVIARTPRSKSTDPRHPKGLIQRHLKLITMKGERGLKYRTLSVPGGTVKGSPAYHALSAIYAFHGYPGRPLTIQAKPGSVLTFPLERGAVVRNPNVLRQGPGRARGPRNWIATKKVYQPTWEAFNPWMTDIFTKNLHLLTSMLHREGIAAKRARGERKIVIG